MTSQEQQLNLFLVHVFNDILHLEEISLRAHCENLSLSEMHVLEAVEQCAQDGAAGMAEIAAELNVTPGTATVAIKTLEQKGYLTRARVAQDKRRVRVSLTPQAQPVLQEHAAFHEKMVAHACDKLSAPELDALCTALDKLHLYFSNDFAPTLQ